MMPEPFTFCMGRFKDSGTDAQSGRLYNVEDLFYGY